MRRYRRSLANFAFFDQEAIEKKLEQMAANGWMICRAGNLYWTYEKIPPQKLRFAVTYFPGASALDPGPSQQQLDKEDYCAQAGWHLVLRWDAMQIFCTDREDAVPLETDPVPQVANIRQTMRKNMLTGQLVGIAAILWFLFLQLSQFRRDPVEYFSSTVHLMILPIWLLDLFASLFQLFVFFRWQKKAKQAAQNGLFYPMHTNKFLGWSLAAVSVLLLLVTIASSDTHLSLMFWMLALFAAIYFLGRRLMGWMKRKGVSRWINLAVTGVCAILLVCLGICGTVFAGIAGWIPMDDRQKVDTYMWNGEVFDIYDDPLPLDVEDLADVTARWSREADRQESMLLARGEYRQRLLLTEDTGSRYNLHYEIVDVKLPALYGFIREHMLLSRQDEVHAGIVFTDHFEPADPAVWGALEAYRLHWSGSLSNTYLVCWENRIAQIRFYWEPTPEQLVLAGEKLRP